MNERKLPVHGFVLAGGRSSRMGRDKALLAVDGLAMVEAAVRKLEPFCEQVSIAGNREDLAGVATVVCEERTGAGPGSGIEAGLRAATQPWALFMPVDVPLVPAELLRAWAEQVLREPRVVAGHLYASGDHPAFCMVRSGCAAAWTAALDGGERRLTRLLDGLVRNGGIHRVYSVRDLRPGAREPEELVRRWFLNVNTPEELEEARKFAAESESAGDVDGERPEQAGADEILD